MRGDQDETTKDKAEALHVKKKSNEKFVSPRILISTSKDSSPQIKVETEETKEKQKQNDKVKHAKSSKQLENVHMKLDQLKDTIKQDFVEVKEISNSSNLRRKTSKEQTKVDMKELEKKEQEDAKDKVTDVVVNKRRSSDKVIHLKADREVSPSGRRYNNYYILLHFEIFLCFALKF